MLICPEGRVSSLNKTNPIHFPHVNIFVASCAICHKWYVRFFYVVVILIPINAYDSFTYILQPGFTGTGAISVIEAIWVNVGKMGIYTLKTKDLQFGNFVLTGGTVSCRNDNLRCHQWGQSSQIDELLFSVQATCLMRLLLHVQWVLSILYTCHDATFSLICRRICATCGKELISHQFAFHSAFAFHWLMRKKS